MVLQKCNLPFCCQGHLKHILENYQYSQKSGNDAESRGLGVSCNLGH